MVATATRHWYEVRNAADHAVLYIFDKIGGGGVRADEFVAQLAAIKASRITLYINSPGGDAHDSIALHSALRRHAARVTVVIDGIAASGASVVAMAGDRIEMAPAAMLMLHDAWGMTVGPAEDHEKSADYLESVSAQIAGIYAERAGGTAAQWRAIMRGGRWYTSAEAVAAGLADAIVQPRVNAYTTGKVHNLARQSFPPAGGLTRSLAGPTASEIAIGRQLGQNVDDPRWRAQIVALRKDHEAMTTSAPVSADTERAMAKAFGFDDIQAYRQRYGK